MIKTHNKTGLKYFCKTASEKDIYKYKGSGVYWNYAKICSVPNIGDKTAQQILVGLASRTKLLLDLESVLDIQSPGGGTLEGKTVCITGELSRPRKAVEKLIMDAGGSPKSGVSRITSYLVTNDPNTGSGKLKKAEKYEIPVINESQLMGLISGST